MVFKLNVQPVQVAPTPANATNLSEQTPLLPPVDSDAPPKRTPSRLPTFQLLILLAVRLADNITLTSIAPYINQAWHYLLIMLITANDLFTDDERTSNCWS